MKVKILLAAVIACSLPSLCPCGPLAPSTALASPDAPLAVLAAAMLGEWRHASNGDRWVFDADGSYTFTSGAAKRRAGTFSHSGTWSVSDYRPSHSDAANDKAMLSLRTTRRVVFQNGRRHTLSGTRRLSVPVETTEADGQVIINRVSYWQKDDETS